MAEKLNKNLVRDPRDFDRRSFLSNTGKALGLMAVSSPAVGALLGEVRAAGKGLGNASPARVAMDEDYWSTIQQAFSVTRGIINLNNGGVSPSPRLVTEAFVRYTWQQEDATAYTMWRILEPQSETVREGLAEIFGCSAEEIAITRNASESLEILLMGMDFEPGDEILTTTQDYPRMLTTLRQREAREGLKLKLIKIPIAPEDPSQIALEFEKAVSPKTKLILISHQVNITGQITPVKDVCRMARKRGIETIVDGAHSFAQFDFRQDDLDCDYFGTSLHKWLHAPKGTGLLYVKKEKIPKVWALMASEEKNNQDIRKFEEIGTHSAAMRLAIGEAVLFHNAIGGKRKEERLRYLSRYWMDRLRSIPNVGFNTSFDPRQFCAIANVKVDGMDPGEIGNYLMSKHKILTTPIVHDEFTGIRITPNIYTATWELDRFCDVMEHIIKNGLPKSQA
ncbi:MAG: aminotransferase class V-fold PLP-dependent enzyme [Acidobacteria bacterium]|nr:MAG: aminotransferase class V-fold PLP-dependent enzyme [Acidobacteriota bacterium]REK01198.1 MAG: aminotransferase class V-fold PLP-dependent enzyme [Acidobacteriota bacterium]REK14154.1 MAG: aminotransferase class V-fold PLP-dependent enzyme [Acidobacteriota bacterium]REK44869.1 MAG: aminotransferase class V-fold PLP-dependent enzyme [Acidobacteriota bacterium]